MFSRLIRIAVSDSAVPHMSVLVHPRGWDLHILLFGIIRAFYGKSIIRSTMNSEFIPKIQLVILHEIFLPAATFLTIGEILLLC